ncbi:NAC domain [Musa troglodytarum]|uniref:NAC domain n=1 Tax=Musa troglodytarum TaxID=320322 RepID=A0A9E7FY41_9LILI|nr:NAC domain [Musa troglodytarum]
MIKPDKIPAYNPRSLYPKPSCERSESRGSEDARPGPVVHGEEEQLLSAQEKQEEEQQLQEQEQGERKENDAPIVEDVKEGDSDNEDDDDDDDGGTEGEHAHTLSRTPPSPLCHIFPEILDLNLEGIDLAVAEMGLFWGFVTARVVRILVLVQMNLLEMQERKGKLEWHLD